MIAATMNPSSIVHPIAFEEKEITTSLMPRLDGVSDKSSEREVIRLTKATLKSVVGLFIAIYAK